MLMNVESSSAESYDFNVRGLQQEPQFSFEDAPIPPKKPFEPATVNLAVSGIVKQLSQFGITPEQMFEQMNVIYEVPTIRSYRSIN